MKIKVIAALILLFPAFSLSAEEDNESREDEIKTLLYAVDIRAIEYNDEITYVQKVNMGIPGGDNWLVEWYKSEENIYLIVCYAIQKNREIINRFFMGINSYHFKASRFDIIAGIPGKRVRDSTTVIGDYNNDGVDELFMFIFGGSRTKIEISGYNPDIGSFFCMCSVDSAIVDPENGPAPVEFITYKGMEGFKVYCIAEQPHVAPPKNIINGLYAWYFYAWDGEAREYVEVEEYIEGVEYTKEDKIKTFLQATDKQSIIYNYELTLVEKVNWGLPEGDNWLVVWSRNGGNYAKIYVIDGTEVKREMDALSTSRDPRNFSPFDIYKSLPGMTIRDGICQIGDFNGDGLDEILVFGAGPSRPEVQIYGYERELNRIKIYCAIPHGLIDPENGPSPLEFVSYKGMRGFKVYYDLYWRPKESEPTRNIINEEYAWYFYAWDEEVRKYVEVEEYTEGAEYTEEDKIKTWLLATDRLSTINSYEITMVKKVNWGLPEGDNWMVVWNLGIQDYVKIYVIDGTEVKREMNALSTSRDPRDSPLNIYQSLPGMTIKDGIGQIGDFNGDGLDEILILGAGPSRSEVRIYGYERELDDIKIYSTISHGLIDPENGPSPLEFVSYKGMRGFKVYYDLFWRPKESEPPRNIINEEYAWYFYAWDEEVRKYVEVEEYIDGAEYAEVKEEEPAPPPREAVAGSRRTVFFIVLAAGLLALGIVAGAVLLRKKK